MGLLFSFAIIVLSSFFIYIFGKIFAESSSAIGDYFNLPKDVKGATLDAISSSAPELLVALYSVIFFQKFEVGIGTIAGSALFNLLVIPGLCVFLAPIAFRVHKRVLSRDAVFYMISIMALALFVFYLKIWGLVVSLILLGIYLIYLSTITSHTIAHLKHSKKDKQGINIFKEVIIFVLTFGLIALFTYFLTDHSIIISGLLKISPIFIAFTITAIATSVPDTIISLVNARKGSADDATSNVFGSNIFDILVGLGLPLLIYTLLKGPVEVAFMNFEIILGLFVATLVVLYFFMNDSVLSKKEGATLLGLYILFLVYVTLLSIGVF